MKRYKTFVIVLFFVSANLFSEEKMIGTLSFELRNYDNSYTGDWIPSDSERDSLKESIWIIYTDIPRELLIFSYANTGETVNYLDHLIRSFEHFRPERFDNGIKAYLPRYEIDSFKTYIDTQLAITGEFTKLYGKFGHLAAQMAIAMAPNLGAKNSDFVITPKVDTKLENLTEFLLVDEEGQAYQCFKMVFTFYQKI